MVSASSWILSCNPNPDDPIPFPPIDVESPEGLFGGLPFEHSDRGREQIAGYANVSYRFNNVEIAGGVRVDNWKSERTNYRFSAHPRRHLSGRQEETEVLGRGSIAMFFDDDRSMVYGTVSQGFEPGDFNCCGQDFVACRFRTGRGDAIRTRLQGAVAG